MIISESKKFIFIHTYKVAGTSVRKCLDKYATEPVYQMHGYNHLGVQKNSDFNKHTKAKLLKKYYSDEEWSNYFKFVFVRNPWDWQVSLYHYMLESPGHPQHKMMKGFKDFDEYIRWRCANEVRLQTLFSCDDDGNLLIDYVGKYENLNEDFKKICDKIGINENLPHLNKSKHEKYKALYTQETIDLVAEAFKNDIEKFNYNF